MYLNKLPVPIGMNVHYAISDGFQLLEHCLALHEWLGGTFHVTSRKPETYPWLTKHGYRATIDTKETFIPMLNSKNNIIIVPSGSHGYSFIGKNVFFISHGISEKGTYNYGKFVSSDEYNPIPLQFARYINGTYEYSKEYHLGFLNIDTSKKTVLYSPTQGVYSSFTTEAVASLIPLKSTYNVIVKPHALCWQLNPSVITYANKHFLMNIELHNIVPFIDIADVVIGDISASTSAAFYYNKPVVLVKKTDKNIPGALMDESMCTVIKDFSNISDSIEQALAESISKSEARQKYFKTWYGAVDGTEGRIVSERILIAMSNI